MRAVYDEKNRVVKYLNDNENVFLEEKLNVAMRKKFKSVVLPYINGLLEYMSPNSKVLFEKYIRALTKFGNHDVIYPIVNIAISTARAYLKEHIKKEKLSWIKPKKSHRITFTDEENFSIVAYALALKILTPLIFSVNRDKYYYQDIMRITMNRALSKTTLNKFLDFIRFNVISSSYTREHLWMFLELATKKTMESHIISIFNFLITHMFTMMKITDNIFGYIAAYINQTNYYLYTDVYENILEKGDLIQLKFNNDYELFIKETLFMTLDSIIYPYALYHFEKSVEKKRKLYENRELPLIFRKLKITPFSYNRTDYAQSPLETYVVLPILSKLFDVKYIYFLSYKKKTKMLRYYVSLILDKEFNLHYLAKISRSIVIEEVEKSNQRIMKRYLEAFKKLDTQKSNLLQQKRFFFNVLNTIRKYKYYDPVYNDIFVPNLELLSQELLIFFESYFTDSMDSTLKEIMKNNFELKSLNRAIA